jgi:hypothetical protein
MNLKLTAEAFGTLLALSEICRIRTVEPKLRGELIERGLAEDSGEFVTITPAGRRLAETRDVGQVLGLNPPSARRNGGGLAVG